MNNNYIILAMLLTAVSACTTQNAYNSLRVHHELDCQQMQGADRGDCMRRSI